MQRVLDHIDAHLDDELGLDTLSGVAAFSKFHFHRQFAATFGLSVQRYVQLARMKRASFHLAFNKDETVTSIAMDVGYDASDAFARAFRQRLGQTPSAFRREPDWSTWQSALDPLTQARKSTMQTHFSNDDVTVVDQPTIRVAVMEHHGDPARLFDSIQQFIDWRRSVGLTRDKAATYTVFHANPRTTPPADFRLDMCAATDQPIASNDTGVKEGSIPGGRCAVLRIVGHADDVEVPATWLYREWLPASGEELRDFPIYCQRVRFYPDVPENETVTDLYLPLR